MMNKQIVEIFAEGMHQRWCEGTCELRWNECREAQIDLQEIESALAALRAKGFDVYRVEDSDLIVSRGPNDSFGFAAGTFRLVPVGVCDICGGTGWDGETIDGNSIDHGQPCACTVGGEG